VQPLRSRQGPGQGSGSLGVPSGASVVENQRCQQINHLGAPHLADDEAVGGLSDSAVRVGRTSQGGGCRSLTGWAGRRPTPRCAQPVDDSGTAVGDGAPLHGGRRTSSSGEQQRLVDLTPGRGRPRCSSTSRCQNRRRVSPRAALVGQVRLRGETRALTAKDNKRDQAASDSAGHGDIRVCVLASRCTSSTSSRGRSADMLASW